MVREEGDTFLASHISFSKPDDQHMTDIAARSPSHPLILLIILLSLVLFFPYQSTSQLLFTIEPGS